MEEIENYEEKAKVLRENGWITWYHYDSWIREEWLQSGEKYEYGGDSTDNLYCEIMEIDFDDEDNGEYSRTIEYI